MKGANTDLPEPRRQGCAALGSVFEGAVSAAGVSIPGSGFPAVTCSCSLAAAWAGSAGPWCPCGRELVWGSRSLCRISSAPTSPKPFRAALPSPRSRSCPAVEAPAAGRALWGCSIPQQTSPAKVLEATRASLLRAVMELLWGEAQGKRDREFLVFGGRCPGAREGGEGGRHPQHCLGLCALAQRLGEGKGRSRGSPKGHILPSDGCCPSAQCVGTLQG